MVVTPRDSKSDASRPSSRLFPAPFSPNRKVTLPLNNPSKGTVFAASLHRRQEVRLVPMLAGQFHQSLPCQPIAGADSYRTSGTPRLLPLNAPSAFSSGTH
ncbi:hypothetical protein G6F31_020888 [Rhizopus arrhizus]|nr:hypothetical protein G6F31_020888 [Rhizopus arrhizus]